MWIILFNFIIIDRIAGFRYGGTRGLESRFKFESGGFRVYVRLVFSLVGVGGWEVYIFVKDVFLVDIYGVVRFSVLRI